MPKTDGYKTKANILEKAEQLFSEWGFNGTVPPGLKLVITPFESYLTPSNEALSNEVKNESN